MVGFPAARQRIAARRVGRVGPLGLRLCVGLGERSRREECHRQYTHHFPSSAHVTIGELGCGRRCCKTAPGQKFSGSTIVVKARRVTFLLSRLHELRPRQSRTGLHRKSPRFSLLLVKARSIVAGRSAHQIPVGDCSIGVDVMRALFAMGLLLVLCTSANAAPVHHARARHPAVDRPRANATPPVRFAVPGWSDEATLRWLNNASSNVGRGG